MKSALFAALLLIGCGPSSRDGTVDAAGSNCNPIIL
jgi:hypothetical protein